MPIVSPPLRRSFVVVLDLLCVWASWAAALWMLHPDPAAALSAPVPLALIGVMHVLVNMGFGLYRDGASYAEGPSSRRMVLAVGVGLAGTVVGMTATGTLPQGVSQELALYPLLLLSLMVVTRFMAAALSPWGDPVRGLEGAQPILLLGESAAAMGVLRAVAQEQERRWRVVGILHDGFKPGTLFEGVKVIGRVGDLPRAAARLQVRNVVLGDWPAALERRRELIGLCRRAGVRAFVTEGADEAAARARPGRTRPVCVEDLMRRDTTALDVGALRDLLTGKVVMVTGAGGSIGSELCRQIAAYQPSMLVLFEQNEFAIYKADADMREAFPELPIASIVGDIKSPNRLNRVMRHYSPSVVFHAAAYKHVPLMEESNAWEAVQNNVYGTYVLAKAAIDAGVRKFVFVSTDKAVNPVNVMGASKRLAEMVCQSLQASSATRFEMVRFGNVLGSAGSVIPRFQEQIDRGGPVTVTHPEMVRYFMSIPEAAQLVLQAGSMGLGGEIFLMDMGEPVKIVDLARDMIRLSERPEGEIRIVYSGLRPGEKLFEELLADDEHTRPTPHPKLRIAKAREADGGPWLDQLVAWLTQDRDLGDAEVRRDLKRWVPEFQSQSRPALKAVTGSRAA